MRRGFTLLETLIAISMLAMVAAATAPMLTRLGRGHLAIDERLEARALLGGLDDEHILAARDRPPHALALMTETHAEWWLAVTSLHAPIQQPSLLTPTEPGQDPPFTWRPPQRQWLHVTIRTGPQPDAPVLAEVVRLMPEPTPGTAHP